MDYLEKFYEYCEVYFRGKKVHFTTDTTKQQKITEFNRNLKDLEDKAKLDLSSQIDSLVGLALKSKDVDIVEMERILKNSMVQNIL